MQPRLGGSTTQDPTAAALFAGPGEVRAVCRSIDWAATPLGPVDGWPESVRAAVRICLDAGIPMAVWAGPELILICNESYLHVLGSAPPSRVLARPGREVLSGLWDRLGPEFERVMERGETGHHEEERFPLRRGAQAEEAFFTYAFTPIREADGRVAGALNVVSESTGRVRRRAQDVLREAEARVDSVTNNLPGTVVYQIEAQLDGARHFTYLSDAVVGLFGCTPDEAIADANLVYGRFPEEDRERVAQEERRALSGLVPFRTELRFRTTSGGIGWLYATSSPRRRSDGSVVWDGLMIDVTQRRQMEDALRASEERIRAHIDNSPLAIIEFDSDFRVIRWSQQAERMFGWSADEVLGRTIAEMRWVHEQDVEAVARESAGLRGGERPRSLNVNRNYRKDGTLLDCEWYSSALYGTDGSLVSVLSQVLDISDRKRAEEALIEANERLAAADRHKTEFLAVLSHELRNPLAPIRNSVYILEHAAPGGEQARRAREVIDRQARHMTRLIDDLLDVTRIARGKVHLQRERLDLGALARGTAEDHRDLYSSNGVELVVRASEPVFVDGDPTRLAQVIGNLLDNSAKFTPRGGCTVLEVAADRRQAEAVVRVRDNGAGMTPQTLEHLFEPFVQAAQTMERTRGGLGLGLALVKGLVEVHGGTVTARSDGEGKGSEFVVRMPLLPAGVAPSAAGADAMRLPRARRVLVIEDNPDAAQSLREALELGHHEVVISRTGPEGVEAARRFRPDVIFCDIGLPGADGYEVARTIRTDPALRSTFLVALSGYALSEDIAKSNEAGFDRHVAKPAGIEVLARILAEAPEREGNS